MDGGDRCEAYVRKEHLLTGTTRSSSERCRRLLSNGPPAEDPQQRELDYHATQAYLGHLGRLIGD